MSLSIARLTGAPLAERLDDLARLRIAVFREYPYLYEGTMDYERNYLQTYAATEGSVIVGAFDADRLVGASTGLPMEGEPESVRGPFRERGYDISRVFYFGESVLLPEYRGRGTGNVFFDEREAHARALGRFDLVCFCAVIRPVDHPRRPPGHTPLDAFWRKRGYAEVPGFTVPFSWRDLDEAEESAKPMAVWTRALEPSPSVG